MIQWNKLIRKIKISLFDVDKTNADRGTPRPDSHDQIIDGATKAHATHSINPVTNATTDTGYISNKNQQVLAFDGTANKALMGYNPGLDKWGMFVGKDGVDVTTNSDPANLIFNSSQDVFKIVNKGTSAIPSASYSNSTGYSSLVTIAHGQSFTPIVEVYAQLSMYNFSTSSLISVSYVPLPIFTPTFDSGNYTVVGSNSNNYTPVILFGVDSTNIYVQAIIYNGGSSTTIPAIPITYFILQETAN